MGLTRYNKCIKVLHYLRQEHGNTISTDELKSAVKILVGGTEGVVFTTMAFMRETGMIKDIGNCRWEINKDEYNIRPVAEESS